MRPELVELEDEPLLPLPLFIPEPLMPEPPNVFDWEGDWLLELFPKGEKPDLALPGLPEKGERDFSSETRLFRSFIPLPLDEPIVLEDPKLLDEPGCFDPPKGLLLLPPNGDEDCLLWF